MSLEIAVTILAIATALAGGFLLLRRLQMPRPGTERLAITVWAAFGPYDTAAVAERTLYRASKAVFGHDGIHDHEEWIGGHVRNLREWEAQGRFQRAQKLMRRGLLLTAYGQPFEVAFQKVKEEALAEAQAATPRDPAFLGDFLIFQLLGDKFKIDLASLGTELPAGLQESARGWVIIYLAWIFRTLASARYGRDFRERMMEAVRARLQRADELQPPADETTLAKTFDFWFDQLDKASEHAGAKVNYIEVPLVLLAALAFLVLDADSPYYKKHQIEDGADFSVAEVFESARIQAKGFIESAIEIGGPLPSGAA